MMVSRGSQILKDDRPGTQSEDEEVVTRFVDHDDHGINFLKSIYEGDGED